MKRILYNPKLFYICLAIAVCIPETNANSIYLKFSVSYACGTLYAVSSSHTYVTGAKRGITQGHILTSRPKLAEPSTFTLADLRLRLVIPTHTRVAL